MVPGKARTVQNRRSPTRYVRRPNIFHPAFWARGTYRLLNHSKAVYVIEMNLLGDRVDQDPEQADCILIHRNAGSGLWARL